MESNEPLVGLPHRPADDSEEVYFAGSPRLRGELGHVIGFVLLGLILAAVPFFFTAGRTALWIGAGLIAGAVVALIPIVLTRSQRYRISNYRIDFERGVLSRTIDTLELWHVDDVRFHQSLLDRMLRVGTISILSEDLSTPNLILRGLPAPRPLFEALKQRIIAVKRQRGVIKMDMGHHA